jgi:hypothetical protein
MSETITVRFLRDYGDYRKGDVDDLALAAYDRLIGEHVVEPFVSADVPNNKRVKPANVGRKAPAG